MGSESGILKTLKESKSQLLQLAFQKKVISSVETVQGNELQTALIKEILFLINNLDHIFTSEAAEESFVEKEHRDPRGM